MNVALHIVGALLVMATLAGTAAAQAHRKAETVDEILSRAVIERGAFLACARLDQNRQTADLLVRGWQMDLSEAGTVLRAAGFSDTEINAMEERYDIEKAAPRFADLKALGDYCSVLGDWRSRWARLMISIPKLELRRALNVGP